MDDSIFVDLVNALMQYEKEDKDKEQIKKGKDKEDDRIKIEAKSEKLLEETKIDKNPFPSMHIFNVNKTCKNIMFIIYIIFIYYLYYMYICIIILLY